MSEIKTEPTSVEKPEGDWTYWTYVVKKGDSLMAIVKKEFNLKHPRDIQKAKQRRDLILAQNGIKHMNRILVGDTLTLRY